MSIRAFLAATEEAKGSTLTDCKLFADMCRRVAPTNGNLPNVFAWFLQCKSVHLIFDPCYAMSGGANTYPYRKVLVLE
jgi:hypothetical protein